jgi:hypothetical protein
MYDLTGIAIDQTRLSKIFASPEGYTSVGKLEHSAGDHCAADWITFT